MHEGEVQMKGHILGEIYTRMDTRRTIHGGDIHTEGHSHKGTYVHTEGHMHGTDCVVVLN